MIGYTTDTTHRWTMQRTVSWLGAFRRLHRRSEHKSEHFLPSAASPQSSSVTAGRLAG